MIPNLNLGDQMTNYFDYPLESTLSLSSKRIRVLIIFEDEIQDNYEKEILQEPTSVT